MIKHEDLETFTGQYPYGSELFGVYQTLLGWRGRRARQWFLKGYAPDRGELRQSLFKGVHPVVDAPPNEDGVLTRIGRIDVGRPTDSMNLTSTVLAAVAAGLPDDGDHDDPAFWSDAINDDVLLQALDREVRNEAEEMLNGTSAAHAQPATLSRVQANPMQTRSQQTMQFMERESRMAGQVKVLRDNGAVGELKQLFFGKANALDHLNDLAEKLGGISPFSPLDPENILSKTIVSPIGIIHLFREYFFELDSFLGSPVGHVWVAPHTSVELVEINSRRVVTEAMIDESAYSRLERYGESFTLESLHEAVSRANQQDLSFGASVSGSHSWIVGSAQASSSVNYHQTQSESRLAVHDLMRRQTQRITTVMDKSIHTTFKTVTAEEEVSSKRYVVANPGDEVINYELRRKMRRVAVQVQDVGTYLSWQAFVDDPGRELGVAQLVHLAEPPNLANIPHPQMIVPKASQSTSEVVSIPFSPYGFLGADPAGSDDTDLNWRRGRAVPADDFPPYSGTTLSIQWTFDQKFRPPDKDYRLEAVKATAIPPHYANVSATTPEPPDNYAEKDGYFLFTLYLDNANFHGNESIDVQLDLEWESREDQVKIQAENDKRLSTFVAEQKRAYEEAYVKAARERITMASKIAPRRYEDLRQEERIAIYRRLVRSLAPSIPAQTDEEILAGKSFTYPTMSDQTRHAWSEILNRLFDLEKMLYFVAPEWWRPQARRQQAFGSEAPVLDANGELTFDAKGNVIMKPVKQTAVPERNAVSWGGGDEAGRSNYYITESAAPAHLGSSLGWLLQLDGDSMRNAFLNAPWVKAIVPIRPGREQDAINWLKGVMEGADGLDGTLDAQLNELAAKVAEKHMKSATVSDMPDLIDPAQTVSATPVDRVFEFGFDPLAGGFRAQSLDGNEFEIVDQWIEVVPTDQVAAVSVKYDSVTGRQTPP
jgi:hypothetical protein